MKKDYRAPNTSVVPLHAEHQLLAGTVTSGVKAEISGYTADDDEGSGFTQ